MFSEYIKLLASQKIRFGSVPDAYKDNLTSYCEEINREMEFTETADKLTPSILQDNPS